MRTWRVDELGREARRNLGPAHALLAVLAAGVFAALVSFLLVQGDHALTQEAERRAAGSLVWTATATDQASPLDGSTCSRLSTIAGVRAAGGQTSLGLPALSAYPGGQPLPLTGLTPGAARVFAPTAPWTATTLGGDLAALGEVGDGSWLVDDTGVRVLQVQTVLTRAPLSALTSSVAIPVAPDAPLDECWVRMDPAAVAYGHDVLLAAFPDGIATVAPFVRDQAGDVAPSEVWRRTISQQPWLLAGAALAACVGLVLWSRRAELGVYRAFGTPRSALAALVVMETTLTLVPALAAGVLGGVLAFAATHRGGAPEALVATSLGQVVAAALTASALTVVATFVVARGNLTDILRDR